MVKCVKSLNQELYNYYDEEINSLLRQIELFEYVELETSKLLERVIYFSKARDRCFESMYIDNKIMPPKITI